MEFGSFFGNTQDTGESPMQSVKSGMFSSGRGGMFSGANLGSTLQGVGSIVGAIGSYFGMRDQRKYQDKLFNMEKERIENEKARQDKFDKGMASSFA